MNEDCLFCRLRDRKLPVDVVYEDEEVLGFKDINPKAPVHILVIPKEHFASLNEVPAGKEILLGRLLRAAVKIGKEKGLTRTGYRIVINTGPDSGQAVYHLHVHLLGGRRLSWPPG
ncbi:MAG: histidine triad nucleotide-binding protein [Candidatus Aminicenantales bacterium]